MLRTLEACSVAIVDTPNPLGDSWLIDPTHGAHIAVKALSAPT
jgi:hypothetical protein